MGKIGSVLFVCTGNLCRSPMAEGILRSVLERDGKQGIAVSSAGTWGCVGEGAAPYAIEVCRERGVDISQHVARQLNGEMIREHDLVLGMEFEHLERVFDLAPEAESKTRLLGAYGGSGGKGLGRQIPDPFGNSKKIFEICFLQIAGHVTALSRELAGTAS